MRQTPGKTSKLLHTFRAVSISTNRAFCMAVTIKNNGIEITGLSEFEAKLQKLKTDNPDFEKRLRGVIRKILGHARANLRKDAASGLQMENDPRHAYKAVRYAVYKRIFGGQVNILQSRKAGAERRGSWFHSPMAQ